MRAAHEQGAQGDKAEYDDLKVKSKDRSGADGAAKGRGKAAI